MAAQRLLKNHLASRRRYFEAFKLLQSRSLTQSHYNDGLHKSPVPTDYFQKTLPRLPLPRLEDTCIRYLEGTRPLVSEEQWLNTRKVVEEFEKSDGLDLHKELLYRDHNNQHTNYVSDYWNDMYLKARDSVMFNFSVGMNAKDEPNPSQQNQLVRAGNHIISTLKYLKSLERKELEPYTLPGKPSANNLNLIRYLPDTGPSSPAKPVIPIDMSTFPHMFKATRIPCQERDALPVFPDSKHVCVFFNGNIYAFDVLEDNGDTVLPKIILQQLYNITQQRTPQPEYPVAVLTADNRDFWMKARNRLLDAGNEANLHIIDSSIMLINLDGPVPNEHDHFRAGLHGNGNNRWFDKPFNLVITEEGKMCNLMEHSWGDGMATLYYVRLTREDIIKNPALVAADLEDLDSSTDSKLTLIEFSLTDELKSDIEESMKRFKSTVESLKLSTLRFGDFGSSFIKSKKISPDAFVQLAYQLAFLRLRGFTSATYESCTTAAFKHGRTETVRPATMATKNFCEMIERQAMRPSNTELLAAMSECSKLHTKLVAEASIGQGFDRHLFAMRKLAESQGRLPEIFKDPTYMDSLMHRVCTSTLGALPGLDLGVFAPVVPDGYGIAYGVGNSDINISCTSYQCEDSEEFLAAVQRSLLDLQSVLNG